jgi:hypothetical protein
MYINVGLGHFSDHEYKADSLWFAGIFAAATHNSEFG